MAAETAKTLYERLTGYVFLFFVRLKIQFKNFAEYVRVVFKYYSHPLFFKIDTALLFSYLFANPFHISKRFLLQKGEQDLYTYGETPLTTLDTIANRCGLTAADTVIELGCGRGRTCFWLNQFVGCRVIGIDFVPIFIEKASKVKERFGVQGVEFHLEDLFQSDLQGASVIYLYGTCFSDNQIKLLTDRFSCLPAGTKIITVSYALAEFQPAAPFKIVEQFPALFTWGEATVTLQVKTNEHEKKPSHTRRL